MPIDGLLLIANTQGFQKEKFIQYLIVTEGGKF
jgi:hypothetical protein